MGVCAGDVGRAGGELGAPAGGVDRFDGADDGVHAGPHQRALRVGPGEGRLPAPVGLAPQVLVDEVLDGVRVAGHAVGARLGVEVLVGVEHHVEPVAAAGLHLLPEPAEVTLVRAPVLVPERGAVDAPLHGLLRTSPSQAACGFGR